MLRKALFYITMALPLSAIADEPHIVPAVGCQLGQLCCPSKLVCDYLEGCGDLSQTWYVKETPGKSWKGLATFNLIQISAYDGMSQGDRISHSVQCRYQSPDMTFIGLSSVSNWYFLTGSWVYGFMKTSAMCPSNNSIDCTAGKYKIS